MIIQFFEVDCIRPKRLGDYLQNVWKTYNYQQNNPLTNMMLRTFSEKLP